MAMNHNMSKLMKKYNDGIELDSSLRAIIDSGYICDDGCWLLKELQGKNIKYAECKDEFQDCIDYERFINHIHLDYYVDKHMLENAVIFANEAVYKWKSMSKERMLAVVSMLDGDYVVHVFLSRGDSWYGGDLDKSLDAVLVVDSEEV